MTKKSLVDFIISKIDENHVDIVEARDILMRINPKDQFEAVRVIEHYFGKTHAHLAGSVDGCPLCAIMRKEFNSGKIPTPIFKGGKI